MSAGCRAGVADRGFVRRARPALGTLVELGVSGAGSGASQEGRAADAWIGAAVDAAFATVAAVEAALSRFDPRSAIHRFNAAPAGARIAIGADERHVLAAALGLQAASDGLFDISLGSGAGAWALGDDGRCLCKLQGGVALDLGGIGKGYAVDRAVEALAGLGIASGWVNAGGDLRVFGALSVPIDLRDESTGGVRRFGHVGDGAFATSRLGAAHVSVAAERCIWADALTKVVAASGNAGHPILQAYGAKAWLH